LSTGNKATMSQRTTLLIVYHSLTGGTLQMVEAASTGARQEESVEVRVLHASQAGPQDLLQAQGYLFATPENLAAISGLMKDFFDRSYYGVLDRIQGRPYASWSAPAATVITQPGRWNALPPAGA
jgi:multimeric flavodoxin WrbA